MHFERPLSIIRVETEGGLYMKTKKLIAPIVITVLLALYWIAFVAMAFLISIPLWAKLLGSLIPLALIGVSLFVLVERIKEVRSGEEDDLSQY